MLTCYLSQIDFLEEENDRLQQEVRRLQSASGDPKTPAPAAEPPRSPTRNFSTDSFSSTSSSTSSVDQVPTSEAATAEVTTKISNTFIYLQSDIQDKDSEDQNASKTSTKL
ncbi:hypothetical protein quinque_009653 [Culex quinquefasciatus]